MENLMIAILNVLIGVILLTRGQRLFCLFVGCVGFWVGFQLTYDVVGIRHQWLQIAISLGAGILGMVIATFFQKAAVIIFGFAAGGAVGLHLLTLCGVAPGQWAAVPYGAAGIIGAVLLYFLFDWALLTLSALVGAMIVLQVLPLDPPVFQFCYVLLIIVGISIQSKSLRQRRQTNGK